MTDRIAELSEIAAVDEDVMLQLESEIALMPETREEILERHAREADEIADTFAPPVERASAEAIDDLADEAGF